MGCGFTFWHVVKVGSDFSVGSDSSHTYTTSSLADFCFFIFFRVGAEEKAEGGGEGGKV